MPNDDTERFPDLANHRRPTYVVTGLLSVAMFGVAGLLWGNPDPVPSYWSNALLNLGSGTFAVFLLEFILPTFLGFADTTSWLVRRTQITWHGDGLAKILRLRHAPDYLRLREAIETQRFPSSTIGRAGVRDTGRREEMRPVLEKHIAVDCYRVQYYVFNRTFKRRQIVIEDIVKLDSSNGLP